MNDFKEQVLREFDEAGIRIEEMRSKDGMLWVGIKDTGASFEFGIYDKAKSKAIISNALDNLLVEVEKILEDNRDETLWGDKESNEVMKVSIDAFIEAVKTDLEAFKKK